ncbi:MAG: Do family serine endopeptidase, partial [Alphaproteobacteria bacterium]|nr:Do family serine endopeptidase [Alphaproteobacteria bacterium]
MKKIKPLFSNTPLARTGDVMDAERAMKYFWTSSLLGVLALCLAILNSPAQAADRPDSFADLAERLSPAVVNISTSMVVNNGSRPDLPRFPEGSPFEDFFKEFEDRGQARRTQSLGSGFIIDSSGIVVTNNHVIENADKISVILANDEVFEAELIGRDQKTDIAVLKIDPGNTRLSAVSFGDSDKLRVGDWVIAIGNPFGLGGTVTAGIVSARGRDIGSGPYDDFIQTDASINRGNSGGPLFNLDGDVIGINTAIFSQSGGSVGIGFAISANLATQVVQQLQDFGRTRRGWLGVFIQEVTEDIAESLGLKTANGALVASVTENGPADKAGLQAGDVILKFDGQAVEKSRDLPRIVAETAVEKTVEVELVRDGKTI